MKKFVLLGLMLAGYAVGQDYSIIKIEKMTAQDKKAIASLDGLDGFEIKTSKGLQLFHSSTADPAFNTLKKAKVGQCVKVSPNIDEQMVNGQLIYGVESAVIIDCNAPQTAIAKEVKLNKVSDSAETKGLKVVNFSYNGMNYDYRIYCPNLTVRNLTTQSSPARELTDEEQVTFAGKKVLISIATKVCK